MLALRVSRFKWTHSVWQKPWEALLWICAPGCDFGTSTQRCKQQMVQQIDLRCDPLEEIFNPRAVFAPFGSLVGCMPYGFFLENLDATCQDSQWGFADLKSVEAGWESWARLFPSRAAYPSWRPSGLSGSKPLAWSHWKPRGRGGSSLEDPRLSPGLEFGAPST